MRHPFVASNGTVLPLMRTLPSPARSRFTSIFALFGSVTLGEKNWRKKVRFLETTSNIRALTSVAMKLPSPFTWQVLHRPSSLRRFVQEYAARSSLAERPWGSGHRPWVCGRHQPEWYPRVEGRCEAVWTSSEGGSRAQGELTSPVPTCTVRLSSSRPPQPRGRP